MTARIAAGTTAPRNARHSIRRHVGVSLIVIGLLFPAVVALAATTNIAGSVIGAGSLMAESNVKRVQHPTGGVVSELRVDEGSRVRRGDVIVRLDKTAPKANFDIVQHGLNELHARQARLVAERGDATALTFPAALLDQQGNPDIAAMIASERTLFDLRTSAETSRRDQFQDRIAQYEKQITGLEEQLAAKRRGIDWTKRELEGVRDLWAKKLIQLPRLSDLERDLASLEGERSQIASSIAEVRGRISDTRLQMLQLAEDRRSEAAKELREVEASISELAERLVAARDQLDRIEIRAPQNGTVHELSVHTVGGVIAPGETIMTIVPADDALLVDLRIAPQDIDQMYVGQGATLRLSAFNQRTTPEIPGTVSMVSRDLTTDPISGARYFRVYVKLDPDSLAKLPDLNVVAGMPVEAFMQTGDRTLLSYLTKPLSDQVFKAFREE